MVYNSCSLTSRCREKNAPDVIPSVAEESRIHLPPCYFKRESRPGRILGLGGQKMSKHIPVLPKHISVETLLFWDLAVMGWIGTVLIGAKGKSAEDFFIGIVLTSIYFGIGWAISMDFGARWKNVLAIPVYAWMVSAPILFSVTIFIGVSQYFSFDVGSMVVLVGGSMFALVSAVTIHRLGILDVPKP